MKELKVDKVIICKQEKDSENYQNFKRIVNEKKIKVIIVKCGDKLLIEKDLNFQILWPKIKYIQDNILNNNSIVAKLTYKNFSMLFTGDIEEVVERQIIKDYEKTNILKATVLKVAHHGSKSSSIQNFLEQVKPKIALIGVGENNTFGHPNDKVIKRLENLRNKNI